MKTMIDLTDSFPFKFDVDLMKRDIENIKREPAFLDHYDPALSNGWRGIMLKSIDGKTDGPEAQRPTWDLSRYKRTVWAEKMPYFASILDLFDRHGVQQGRMRILKLSPGAYIGKHTDRHSECGCLAFNRVRLHVPIQTNDQVEFHVNDQRLRLKEGRFYYVNFSQEHWVSNKGTEDRLHLVMDLEMNDWLWSFFPKPSLGERIEYAAVRYTYPIWWRAWWPMQKAKMAFWRNYNNSWPQRMVHRLRGGKLAARHS